MSNLRWSTKLINFLENDLQGDQSYFSESPYYDRIPGIRKAGLLFDYTEEELRSFQTIPAIVVENAKILVPSENCKRNIKLRHYQEEILDSLETNRFNCILQARQSGISTVVAIHTVSYIIENTDKNVLIVAAKQDSACELIQRIKDIYISLPFYLKPGVIAWNKNSIKFDNGCMIKVHPNRTSTESTVGYTVHNLILQDAAHIHHSTMVNLHRTLVPVIGAGRNSKITMYSSPNGINMFYEVFSKDNDYHKFTVKWYDVPGRDEDWKKREIANLGSEELFRQEYECSFVFNQELFRQEYERQEYERSFVCKHETPIMTVEVPTKECLQKRLAEIEEQVKVLKGQIEQS